MNEPYKTVFAELAPLLERLHFSKRYDSSLSADFNRGDGYFLRVNIEHIYDGFTAVLEKDGAGHRGRLSPEYLMEVIEPSKGLEAKGTSRNGYDKNVIMLWWGIFLTFLIDHESVVFRFPSTAADPAWRAYVELYNRRNRERDIPSCFEIDI
jgi:hypothetical protein